MIQSFEARGGAIASLILVALLGAEAAGAQSLLTLTTPEPPGVHCQQGGTKIESGLDANANGVLDNEEVSSVQYQCSGVVLNWLSVSGPVQAMPNTGYIASNDSAPVVITLPSTLNIGDLLSVQGAGAGGWQIAQNAGQQVLGVTEPGAVWNRTGPARPQHWSSIASSSDGKKLVAAVGGYTSNLHGQQMEVKGPVYTSSNGGRTWTARSQQMYFWTSVASSADGLKLMGATRDGMLFISADSGQTWTSANVPRAEWASVASSADGQTQLAAQRKHVFASTDFGQTWRQIGPIDTNGQQNFVALAMSADGTKLVAADSGNGIYRATKDGSGNWTWSMALSPWTSVASSAGGMKLASGWASVAISADGSTLVAGQRTGEIYVSTDAGFTWVAQTVSVSGTMSWKSMAISADGRSIVAAGSGIGADGTPRPAPIYFSHDGGMTWAASTEGQQHWTAVASSADGTRLVAAGAAGTLGGHIYISTTGTTPGTGGSISGDAYGAVDLLYRGNGVFDVMRRQGQLTVR